MMTHEQVIAVLQARLDGKEIERKTIDGEWIKTRIDFQQIMRCITEKYEDFRVAPEPPKPEYVPFESMEEFMPHRDKWFKIKGFLGLYRMSCFNSDGLSIVGVFRIWKEALEEVSFEDGTPCGKLVEK